MLKTFLNSKQEPVTTQIYKTFNLFGFLCCFPSDPLGTVAHIPCCGYIPRQTIDLHLHVNNKSNQPVVEITIQLIQVSIRLLQAQPRISIRSFMVFLLRKFSTLLMRRVRRRKAIKSF